MKRFYLGVALTCFCITTYAKKNCCHKVKTNKKNSSATTKKSPTKKNTPSIPAPLETTTAKAELEAPASKNSKKAERIVTITNEITKKMRGYSYVLSTYQPTVFTITVNGKELNEDDSLAVPLSQDEVAITYYCEFQKGKRKSSRTTIFKVKPDVKNLHLTFNWHADPRLVIDEKEAHVVSTQNIEF